MLILPRQHAVGFLDVDSIDGRPRRLLIPRPSGRPCSASPACLLARRSDEPLDELERRVGDQSPAAVDRERVTAVRQLDDLGDTRIAPLLLERGIGDRPRHGAVLFPGDDQQRTAVGVLGVDLRLGPRVQVGRGRLEQRRRPASNSSGVKSLAVTSAPVLAAGIEAFPVPAATSSTRIPDVMPHPSTRAGPSGNRNVSTIDG
jgi:hypothetical protein